VIAITMKRQLDIEADCTCINCRLARIELALNKVNTMTHELINEKKRIPGMPLGQNEIKKRR